MIPFFKISHCIHKITCNICQQIYIGETKNELPLSINLHRSSINKSMIKNSSFQILHFIQHDFKNITITVLEKVVTDDEMLLRENYYIPLNKCLYPYSLNTDSNLHSLEINCMYDFFSSVYLSNFNYNRVSRGKHSNTHFKNK